MLVSLPWYQLHFTLRSIIPSCVTPSFAICTWDLLPSWELAQSWVPYFLCSRLPNIELFEHLYSLEWACQVRYLFCTSWFCFGTNLRHFIRLDMNFWWAYFTALEHWYMPWEFQKDGCLGSLTLLATATNYFMYSWWQGLIRITALDWFIWGGGTCKGAKIHSKTDKSVRILSSIVRKRREDVSFVHLR